MIRIELMNKRGRECDSDDVGRGCKVTGRKGNLCYRRAEVVDS